MDFTAPRSLFNGKAKGIHRLWDREHPHLQPSWFTHRYLIRSCASQTVVHSTSPFTSKHKHTFLQGDSGRQRFLWKLSNWCQLYMRSSSSNAGMPHTRLWKLSWRVFLFSHFVLYIHSQVKTAFSSACTQRVRKHHRRFTPQFFQDIAGLDQLGQWEQIPEQAFWVCPVGSYQQCWLVPP